MNGILTWGKCGLFLITLITLITRVLGRTFSAVFCALFLNLLVLGSAGAAITATVLLPETPDTNDANSYTTTASITPTANKLILAWVTNTKATTPDIPTLSGNGLTWVQVATVTWGTIGAPMARTTLFRAMGAAPTAGSVTINFGGVTQTGAVGSVVEFSGVDTSGTDGSGAVVQSVTGRTDSATAAAGLTITLAALGNAANASVGGFSNMVNSATSISAGAGYSMTPGGTYATPSISLRSEFKVPGSTTVNVTQSAVSHIGGIAVEVKVAPTTTLGDGTTPASRNVGRSTTNRAVDAFTLSTSSGTDTLTGLTVTLSGTGAAADIAASGVKIWKDNGTTANEWDASDTQIGSGVSMSGTTATFTGLTEGITTTSTQYLITYDISAAATPANTLLGAVTAATVTNALSNNDTTDNTLTVAAVSGTVYSDEGTTILAGKSVKLVKAGTGGNSDTTDAFGRYAITATLAAGNAIIAYIDNDATYDANTVTLVGGTTITGLDLYAGRVITRCDNACSLTIANMSTALGAYTDAGDLLYSMAGSLTVSGTGTAINIPTGHTFAPGASITVTPAMEVRGTFTAGGFNHTLSGTGTPFVVTGTFTPGTSTIKYTGTTTATNIATTNYFNLQLAPTAATTYSLTGNLTGANALTGNLTIDLNATLDATTANNYNLTAVTATINFLGTYLAKASTITLSGSWSNTGTFTAGTSTVIFNATSGTKLITPNGQSFYNISFNDAAGTATYQLQGALTATNDLTVTDGILDTKAGSSFAINVTRDFTQAGGQVLAQSSTITVGRDFTANGAELSTGFNSASLVMTGTGGVTYGALANSYANGFYNLTAGQSGNTTTLNNKMAVLNLVTVGTGTLTGAIQLYLYKTGTPPFVFDAASTVSVAYLKFFGTDPAIQYLPPLTNGYSSNIVLAYYTNLTQSGAVTINPGFSLVLDGDLTASRYMTYSTAGYALNVGGNIQIGLGGDTGLKTFNGTNSTITVGGNFDVVPKGAGTTQAVFTSTGSTVILNGSALQTARLTGSNFNNLTITNASAAGVSFLDAFNAANITDTTAGSKLTFINGATYGISGTLSLTGTSANKITLLSDLAGTRFTLNPTGAAQSVSYVNVKDSQASTNNITASGSTNSGGNDDAEAVPHWIFDSCPVVTSTADSGAGTLRSCLTYANSNPGTTISFNIATAANQSSGGDSWWRISPTSVLPTITAAGTVIDGTTQTTNQGNTNTLGPEIELYGAAGGFNGFTIQSASNTIRGFILTGFGVSADTTTGAVLIDGASATGNTVAGNYIGTNYAGTAAPDDATYKKNERGIYILNGASSNTIGGTTAADRNVIAGQRSHGIWLRYAGTNNNIIIGNHIGTNAAGTAAIANSYGIYLSTGGPQSNRIGGTTAGERNIISGNINHGIWIRNAGTTSNQVIGNYIGTNVNGTAAVPNGNAGLYISTGTTSNTIGGATPAERNIISGNTNYGVWFNGTGTNSNNLYGNYIGLDKNGTAVLPNGSGVLVEVDAQNNAIGGSVAGQGNIISGNTNNGVVIGNGTAISNINVYGNKIGTGPAGTETTLGNGASGVIINSTTTPSNITIGGTNSGEANLIAYQGGDGVFVFGASSDKVIISGNSIHSNTGLGIDLDPDGVGASGGANNNKARPTITAITANGVNFDITATVTAGDTIEFFRVNNTAAPVVTADPTGSGEGYLYLGKCVDNGACSGPHISAVADANAAAGTVEATLLPSGLVGGDYVSATGTDGTNGTSEFSANVMAGSTVSGTVYTDEGVTNIGGGKTVRLIKNGIDSGSAVTNASGQYTVTTASLVAGDAMLVYVDGDATYKGTTVTVSNGANLAGLNIYSGKSDGTGDAYVIVRHDNAGVMTSALMSTALGAYVDTDIKYTVPAGVLTVSTYNILFVPATHTFAPGANTSVDGVKILGSFTGGSYTHTLTGTWNATAGAFTAGTSTISMFVKMSNHYFYPGASSYYNVVFDSHEFFIYLGASFTATGDVTLKTTGAGLGTFTMSNYNITAANFFWPSSFVVAGTGVVSVSGNWNKTGGGYFGGNMNIAFTGSGNSVFTPGSGSHGSVTVNKSAQTAVVSLATNNLVMAGSKALTITSGIFDLAGRNLDIGGGSTFSNDGTLRLQGSENLSALVNDVDSGTVEYNGSGNYTSLAADATYYHVVFNGTGSWTLNNILIAVGNLTITSGTLNAAGFSIEVMGNWSNSGTFNHGNGEVLFSGTGQSISGNTSFYNLTKSVATAQTLTFAAGSTTTINGTATINGASGQLLSLRSGTPGTRWNFNLGAGAVKAISYVDVKDSDASGSDVSKKPINPTSSTDSGNNIEWFAYIAVDGIFTEWCDASGTDFCVDDEGGNNDWTNPDRLDITRFGVASNRADTFYVLFGYDDTSLTQESTACVLVDTDSDNYINKAICIVINNNPTTVSSAELYNCDDSITGGCGGATLSKTYVASDYGISNTSSGPWNTDTLIELKVPYTDLAIANGTVILNTLISYPGSGFLKSPKDSIFGATSQDYEKRIQYDTGNGTGVIIAGPGNQSVSGIVYSDEGTTAIGSGKTIRLIKNGVSVGTDTTDAAGGYFISGAIADGNGVIVYIDGNDGSVSDGTTVSVFKGPNLTTLDIYKDHLITRHDNAGALTNALMKTALDPYSDAEILYSVDGSNVLTVSGATTELHVPAAHTFTPAGNVSTAHIKVVGTMFGGTNTFTVSGNWDSSNGIWWPQTSTVNLTGTGTLAQYVVATPWSYGFNNLSLAANGQTTTLTSTNLWVNYLTTGTGTLTDAANDYVVVLQGTGTAFIDGGATLTFNRLEYRAGAYTQNVVGRNYTGINALIFNTVGGAAGSGVYEMQGNVIANAVSININNSLGNARNSILNTNNYSLTASTLYVGANGDTKQFAVLNAGSSNVDINGDVVIYPSDANGDNVINAGTSTWTVSGNWTNSDTFTPGTSTITLDGTNQTITGNTTFNNLTKSVATARTLTFAAGSTTTVNGIATLNGASGQLLSLISSSPATYWNFTLGAASTKAISYVSVTDSDASGSAAAKKPINPTNSTDGGHNVSWFMSLLTFLKTVAVTSDPVNGATNPKNIPGAEVLYTMRVTNSGSGTVDNNTAVITDPIPANTELFTGNLSGGAPFIFTNGTPSSGLSCAFIALGNLTDCIDFSNNSGATWTYVPNGSFDPAVTNIRFILSGTMNADTGSGSPKFDLNFRVRVK